MDMWDKIQGTIILFLVLISSASSEENCAIQKFTGELEYSGFEANLWVKPEYDFERIEVHIRVRSKFSADSPSYYDLEPMPIKLYSILDSSYEADPYWIPLAFKVNEECCINGKGRLLLCVSVNQTKTFKLHSKLLNFQDQYENYKLSAIGGLEFSSCNQSPSETETPPVPNSDSDSDSDSYLSNGNLTRTYEGSPEKGTEPFMIIILVVVAILTVILIAAIVFVEWRSKIIERDIQFLSQLPSVRESKGQENMYFASPEGITMARAPPPSYSPTLPRKEII